MNLILHFHTCPSILFMLTLPHHYPAHAPMPLRCCKLVRVSWEEESLKVGRLTWKSSADA